VVERDETGTLYIQLALFSFMHDDAQIAIDFLRFDLRWSEPGQWALFGFHYTRWEPDRWSIELDLCYLNIEYDSFYGYQGVA